MPIFGWNEISRELYQIADGDQLNDGWTNPTPHSNGVKILLSDRNHLALEVEADTLEEADALFAAVSEEYRRDKDLAFEEASRHALERIANEEVGNLQVTYSDGRVTIGGKEVKPAADPDAYDPNDPRASKHALERIMGEEGGGGGEYTDGTVMQYGKVTKIGTHAVVSKDGILITFSNDRDNDPRHLK